jgi:hypothetical protein
MLNLVVVDYMAFLAKLSDDGLHVDRVPDDDRVGDQVQACGLVCVFLWL